MTFTVESNSGTPTYALGTPTASGLTLIDGTEVADNVQFTSDGANALTKSGNLTAEGNDGTYKISVGIMTTQEEKVYKGTAVGGVTFSGTITFTCPNDVVSG